MSYFIYHWPPQSIIINSFEFLNQIFKKVIKNSPANAGNPRDPCLTHGSGRSAGVGNGNSLQYSCFSNSMDRGAWWAPVYEMAKNWTQLSDWAHTHITTQAGRISNGQVLFCLLLNEGQLLFDFLFYFKTETWITCPTNHLPTAKEGWGKKAKHVQIT